MYPAGGHITAKNRGTGTEVLHESWIQTRIKQKRPMGKRRASRITMAEMDEGANLVNVSPNRQVNQH